MYFPGIEWHPTYPTPQTTNQLNVARSYSRSAKSIFSRAFGVNIACAISQFSQMDGGEGLPVTSAAVDHQHHHHQPDRTGKWMRWKLLLLLLLLFVAVGKAVAESVESVSTATAAANIDATVNAATTRTISRQSSAVSHGSDISILIMSQKDAFNLRLANRLRDEIRAQVKAMIAVATSAGTEVDQEQNGQGADGGGHVLAGPRVHLSHERCSVPGAPKQTPPQGAWAISPLLARGDCVDQLLAEGSQWLVICEALSHVNVTALVAVLHKHSAHQELFLGHALHDAEPTIVHHFSHFENPKWFAYPALRAGLALSRPLVLKLTHRLRAAASPKLASEFFIDAAHELAMLLWDEGRGHQLTGSPHFCLRFNEPQLQKRRQSTKRDGDGVDADKLESPGCAVFRHRLERGDGDHGATLATMAGNENAPAPRIRSAPLPSIMFAVKTCTKFHRDRVSILQQTWAPRVQHLRFYSDTADQRIPTIATGVANTATGHCAKMLAIFRLIVAELQQSASLSASIEWIVLADDDTLFNISALADHLGHYRHTRHQHDLYLGERYGYRLLAPDGFNYITGGGGIVFARPLVERLVATCVCPSASAPDDMIAGMCVRQLGIEAVHSERFHQARPPDYAAELLAASGPAISFHKFWQQDARAEYDRWLGDGGDGQFGMDVDEQSGSGECREQDCGAGNREEL